MATCVLCGQTSLLISSALQVCLDCLRERPRQALALSAETHRRCRREFGLPEAPPRSGEGRVCHLCVNECSLAEGETGYCGLRLTDAGRLKHLAGTPAKGLLHWYYDPLPTNCVADWVCEGHSHRGEKNLAVFYNACTFNCLFCQNWHYRDVSPQAAGLAAQELAACADAQTFCVCFFGGDPSPQMGHALAAARLLSAAGVRICWETNGSMHPTLADQMLALSLQSGGCVKFDLKAWDDTLHHALTGSSNQRTVQNFRRIAQHGGRRQWPLLIASTLLVPGYVDRREVEQLAAFIATIDPSIPYALLGFQPHFFMPDLPRTSVRHAEEAMAAAQEAGLQRVRIGNRHLLSRDY